MLICEGSELVPCLFIHFPCLFIHILKLFGTCTQGHYILYGFLLSKVQLLCRVNWVVIATSDVALTTNTIKPITGPLINLPIGTQSLLVILLLYYLVYSSQSCN